MTRTAADEALRQAAIMCTLSAHLRLEDLSDIATRQVRHALKVAPLCLGSSDFSSQSASKVAEEQVLASNR